MNILLIIPEVQGTIAKVSYNLYEGLTKLPHNIIVADLSGRVDEGLPFKNLKRLDFNDYFLGKYFKYWTKTRFLKEIKKEYEIGLSISTLVGCNICNAFSKGEEQTVAIFHTRLKQLKRYGIVSYYVYYFLLKFSIRKIDRIVAVNKSAQQDMKKFSRRNDVELIYNIHHFDLIHQQSLEPIESKSELEVLSKPTFLFVGHLFNVKAPDRLINAFASVIKKNPNVNLVFIGENSEGFKEKILDGLIKKYGLKQNVFFWGHKSNPYKYMKACHALVSPSKDEGLPGVIIESLSLGKPVISTNSSMGVWEIMGCDESYNPDLANVFHTDYGLITPNTCNENCNISMLADAMLLSLRTDIYKKRFLGEKFNEKNVISQYFKKGS